MTKKRLSGLAVAFLVFVTLKLCSQGIITGSLSGTVVDTTGAVLPGAKVTVTDLARGTAFTAEAAANGDFSFRSLPIGIYNVVISQTGFSEVRIPNASVNAGVDHGLGKEVLAVGNNSTQVEVTATPSLLETTQVQQSESFDSEQLESLPLNNGFDTVALLEPGVAQTHDLNFSNTNGANFSSNGARGRSNNFELDGQSNNDNSIAGPQIFFGNQDAIDQIQVIQSNFSAQYGRNEGSVVNYITKSGSNAFHGSAFELYEGDFLESFPNQDKTALDGFCVSGQNPVTTGCTPVARLPRFVDNRYGGTFGGPVLKDKLFFFGSTYWEKTRNGSSPFISNLNSGLTPTPAGLQLLATTFPGNAGVAVLQNYGPYSLGIGNPTPVASSITTESVTGPNGVTVGVPVAAVQRNVASGNFDDQEDMGRLDWQATSRDRFFVRYLYQTQLSGNEPLSGSAGIFYNVPDTNHSVGADYTRTLSQHWVNQLRYSFQQSKVDFEGGTLPNCTVSNLTACPGNLAFESGSDLGFGQGTTLPQGRTVKVTQVQDNASYSRGRNNIQFGGEFDFQNSPNVFLPLYNGEAVFNNLTSLVNQNGFFELATGNPVLPFRESDYALYFQDDFKVTSELTINAGLRWEFFGQAINLLYNSTLARESNPATAIWSNALPLAARTTAYVNPYYKNFEPRIGFAYAPTAMKGFVLRGGYSIGVDPAFYNIFLNAAEVGPVSTSAAFGCAGTCLGNGTFTGAALRAQNLNKLPLGGDPRFGDQDYVPSNFRNPYLQTYNLGIEQQVTHAGVFALRYVGSHGVGNFQSVDANPDLAPLKSAFPTYQTPALCTTAGSPGTQASPLTGLATARPNCNLSNLALITNGGFTIYNSLQTSFTTRNLAGFTGSVNYTWSHAVDNSSEIFSTGTGGSTISLPQNPLDPNLEERGTSGFSYPNVASVGMTYTTPKVHFALAALKAVANGYRVNAVYQFNSGQPFNPYQPILAEVGLNNSLCDNTFNFSTVGPGADSCRLVQLNKNAPLQTVAFLQGGVYYDVGTGNPVSNLANYHWALNNSDISSAMNNPFPGSGRNILRAQTYNNLDASIFKDTTFRDHYTVELQMDVYNALNRQYRGTPLTYALYDTGTIGPSNPFLSNAYNSSNTRLIQFGGKIKF